MPLFRRIARRGFSNYPFKKEFQVVNVSDLNRFADGDVVNPRDLAAHGLARKKGVPVKILASGELTKKLVVEGARVSASARQKIVAVGGRSRGHRANLQGRGRRGEIMANPLVDIFRVKELARPDPLHDRHPGDLPPGDDPPRARASTSPRSSCTSSQGTSGALGIEDFLDFFAGGAFKNFSIFMLTIMPYISMSIIMQLVTIVFPKLKKIQEEEGGKKKINRWTRYGTVVVCPHPVLHGHRVREQHPRRHRDRAAPLQRCSRCSPSPRGRCSSCGWATRSRGGASATASR